MGLETGKVYLIRRHCLQLFHHLATLCHLRRVCLVTTSKDGGVERGGKLNRPGRKDKKVAYNNDDNVHKEMVHYLY